MTTTNTARTARPDTSGLFQAVLWMGLSLISFSVIAISGREASRQIGTTELLLWRSIIGVVIIGAIYASQGARLRDLLSPVMPLHIGRSIVHYSGQYLWFYALTVIPLAELFALEFTTPLWVAIVAPFVLGERLSPWRAATSALGFIGAIIVAEPGLIEGRVDLSLSFGTAAAAASALGFAASMLFTKRLTRIDPALKILFWMQVFQGLIAISVLSFVSLNSGRGPATLTGNVTWVTWGWIGALGIAGLGAHLGVTRAFGLADAIIVAPMDFLRLPLIAVVGFAFYGEHLTAGTALGAGLVVIANFFNIWVERLRRLKRP
jgi:drug/metabolite transporter (DMT)-like permease